MPNIFGILSRAVTVNGIYHLESVKRGLDLSPRTPAPIVNLCLPGPAQNVGLKPAA